MNQIHPTAIVEDSVTIGVGNQIGPFCHFWGNVRIGDGNWFGSYTTVGVPPEHKDFHRAPDTNRVSTEGITIGNRNTISEYVLVTSPTEGRTVIGDDCFIMEKTHIAHDCILGNDVTVAPGTVFGGWVQCEEGANIGINCSLRPRVVVGQMAMVGMGAVVTRNCAPFSVVMGAPARQTGWNAVGLSRKGLTIDDVYDPSGERELVPMAAAAWARHDARSS